MPSTKGVSKPTCHTVRISAVFWACPVHATASVFSPSRIFRHPPAATVARKGHRVLVVLAPPEHHLQSAPRGCNFSLNCIPQVAAKVGARKGKHHLSRHVRDDATMGKCVEKKQRKPCARASGGVPGHGRYGGVAPVQKC